MKLLDRPVTRETTLTVFEGGARPVIVTLKPPGLIELRLKGRRAKHILNLSALYWQAAKYDAREGRK